MRVGKIYHLRGFSFRDLRSGSPLRFFFDNTVDIVDYTEYYLLIDDNDFIISAVPV